jgi:chromosome segregation ATPase
MNSQLKYLNLLGVVALACLCVTQWLHDRRLNLEIKRLDQVRLEQSAKIDEQSNQLKGLTEDLDQLKASLVTERTLRAQIEQKLGAAEATNVQLTLERDQFKGAITNWENAVAVRDERMKEANARIEQLAANLNASIRKYNELVTNYNAVVKTLGGTHGQTGKSD